MLTSAPAAINQQTTAASPSAQASHSVLSPA